MSKVDVVRAWKDPEYRASLTREQLASLPASPAGSYELDAEVLKQVAGGVADVISIPSEGWFCTISAECNGGTSCNPFTR
jgi:mersacidin/lichenicidin family type 2 lantibiotic